MIWESQYWKDDLLRKTKDLRRRKNQRRWFESSFARIEQTVMMGFYSVRKLIEAKKLSYSTVHMNVSLITYPSRGKPITLLNWDRIDHLYDLESRKKINLDLQRLCHQFVHSYVFVPDIDEGNKLAGIFFASERTRQKYLHFISIDKIIELFELVGSDYPSRGSWIFDPSIQDYKVSTEE